MSNGDQDTFNYSYLANSGNLVSQCTTDHAGNSVCTTNNTYETTRNVLTTKSNEVASGAVSSYTYAVNQLGQRTQVSQSGSAFATAQSIEWGYDPLGQVTEADHSTDNSQDRNFGYDQIGNRITSTEGSNPAQNYTSNALNQYDSIDGQALSYDPDGNLLSDGQRTYTWDGERCEQTSIADRGKATCPQGQNAKNEAIEIIKTALASATFPDGLSEALTVAENSGKFWKLVQCEKLKRLLLDATLKLAFGEISMEVQQKIEKTYQDWCCTPSTKSSN